MWKTDAPVRRVNRETAGFLASLAFACLASVRDVYFGGVFQATSPLDVAVVAFALCSLVFLPIALARSPKSFGALRRHAGTLVWVNVTSGLAWIAFFHALRAMEPLLVQILFAGVGPLSVVWLDRLVPGVPPAPLRRAERPIHLGLLAALVFAAAVALAGLSGAGRQSFGTVALGIILATGAGVSISLSTVLCRRLNDGGVDPTALVSVRFIGAIVLAAGLAFFSGHDVVAGLSKTGIEVILGASLLLIVLPVYVNQVGVSLASPLTVRVALAVGPVLIFLLQLIEGRLSPSPYSLAAGVLYGLFAVSAALARPSMSRVSMSYSTVRAWRNADE